jgi:hypothetical protein
MKKNTNYKQIVKWLQQRGVRAEIAKPRISLPSYRQCIEPAASKSSSL